MVGLGEPKDRKMRPSGPPRQGCFSPRRTTSPRRREATPRRGCDYLRLVFIAYLGFGSWPYL